VVDRPDRPERLEPRVSLNSLAEYMVATPARRAAIIRDQKRPPEFKTTVYTDAENAIVDYLSAGDGDLDRIYAAQETLLAKLNAPKTDWDEQRLRLCMDALESFSLNVFAFDLEDATVFALPATYVSKLLIGKVAVSIRPEVGYKVETKNGAQSGLIKLYFRKNDPLTEAQAQYIGAALYLWGTDVERQDPPLAPTRCLVYDVFAGASYEGPKAYVRRLNDLQAACDEIALRWPHA